MIFAIRDDDVSFFTEPHLLEDIYKDIWGTIPISLAVVPFHRGRESKYIPQKFWHTNRNYPISENPDLIALLKEKVKSNSVDIMLHGYSHNKENGIAEFEMPHKTSELVKVSKEFLETLLNTQITTFVPPNNRITSNNLKDIMANRLNILGTFSHNPIRKEKPLEVINFINLIRRRAFFSLCNPEPIPYPFVLEYGNYKTLECYDLTDDMEWNNLKSAFESVAKINGIFCIATHHWEVANNTKIRWLFRNLIDFALSFDSVTFTAVSKILVNQ